MDGLAADDQHVYWALNDGTNDHVYARGLAGGEVRQLATVAGQARLTPAPPSRLYVVTVEPLAGPAVRAVDLATGAVDIVQDGVTLAIIDFDMPRAASSSHFFWMDGTTLRSVAHDATTPTEVATSLWQIRRLVTDGASVYALQNGPTQDTILRVDVATGSVTPVVSRDYIGGMLAYLDKVWWVTGFTLESANPDGSDPVVAHPDDGTGIGLPVGVSGRVVAAGDRLLIYDPTTGTSTFLWPMIGSAYIAADSRWLYDASYAAGIVRIPVDVPVRTPETLRDGLATVETLFLDQDWLYWSEWSSFYGVYRISRMRTDGTGLAVLFDGDHRQLAIHDGRLFFMCEAACSLPGWTLVSMPLAGGPITPEASLGLFPQRMIVRNGLFYVVDTADGQSFGVWAIDLAGRRSAQVVRDLALVGIDIDASSRWLYVWAWGGGLGWLDRRPIEAWNCVGAPQSVDPRQDGGNLVGAFHSDGTDLYYWLPSEGLKKLAE